MHELNEAINSIKAEHKFVIFDACHSGGALRRDLLLYDLREIKVNKLIEIFSENKGTCIITACNSDEAANEDAELEHGIFTYALIECLEEASKPNVSSIPYKELYNNVLDAVRAKTGNKQNPQIKCSDEDFKILALPSSTHEVKKAIKLDTTIIPTVQISKASEYYDSDDLEKFERIVIQLIQENRFIEIDKLVKDQLKKIYMKLSKPDISLRTDPKDAIPYYESCREYIKPLLILIRYIIEYYDSKLIIKNLDYVIRFEELTRNKSGYTAIIEIPLIIASEIILNLTSLAYKAKNYTILKKLLETPMNYDRHISRMVYDYRFWVPDLFDSKVITYMKYLFPENVKEDLFSSSNFRDFLEVNFLFDCYSIKFEFPNVCHPVYSVYKDFDVPERMVSKLLSGDPDTINCIKEVFSINDVNDFINLVTARLSEVSKWSSSRFHNNDSLVIG